MKNLTFLTLFFLLPLFLIAQKNSSSQEVYLIENVDIITMNKDNQVIKNGNIIIKNNKILSINGSKPEHAIVINGQGKYLIPGLIDMHVHNLADGPYMGYPTQGAGVLFDTQRFMTLYIANGVTTVFELSARAEHIGQRNEILKGQVIGPRIALAGLIDKSNAILTAQNPQEATFAVKLAKAQGFEFIKTYSQLDKPTFKAMVKEAKNQNMKVVGHIPTAFEDSQANEFFIDHFGLIAHAEELSKHAKQFNYQTAEQYAKLAKANNTWLIPNLSNLVNIAKQARSVDSVTSLESFSYVHPLMQSKWVVANQYNQGTNQKRIAYFDQMVEFHKLIVKAFKEQGVSMLAGTDAGTSGIVWGYSLHDELKLLVEAGLTEQEALSAATIQAAKWLTIQDKIGSIEQGKLADLILLDKNPLDNIENTKTISGVFVNGRWIDKHEINQMIQEVKK
ncbi:amidohydrolase family protein [Myroides pelagicus]|uniref:Amidohydrolase family protein n=2 Tax=Myroides pelagicus TaxID=270914 RepID=A0A7K1GPK9_9FLAO|nr:amidohydrolase family protein [Myroides pelagicus]